MPKPIRLAIKRFGMVHKRIPLIMLILKSPQERIL